MKKYENPMLNIVSISKYNIISTSGERGIIGDGSTTVQGSVDRFRDEWDAGY